jgi:hypothetical protein
MNTIELTEQKKELAQIIFSLNDKKKINEIDNFIKQIIQKKDLINPGYNAKKMTFTEWNKQFEDLNLDIFLEEYGISLKDFRLKIYNSERENGISKESFFEKIDML